jgi:hypothetical protein
MKLDLKGCYGYHNKVIFVTEEDIIPLDLDKEKFNNIDAYIEYREVNSVTHEVVYTKYIIKERYLDNHNNLILICDEKKV